MTPTCPKCKGKRLLVEYTAVCYLDDGELGDTASDMEPTSEARAFCAMGEDGDGCGWSGFFADTFAER